MLKLTLINFFMLDDLDNDENKYLKALKIDYNLITILPKAPLARCS